MNCLKCGKELVNTPGKRVKKFCNSTCRSGLWQKRASENPQPKNSLKSETIKEVRTPKTSNNGPRMPSGLSLTEQIDWKLKHI